MFTCFMLPNFKASVTSIRPFSLAFTFFKVSIAHLRNLVQKTAYFDTVSSVALPPAWQPFLFFSGHRQWSKIILQVPSNNIKNNISRVNATPFENMELRKMRGFDKKDV